MPWCPNCKNEYKEGMTVCADCGATLVDHLEEEKEENCEFSNEQIAAMMAEKMEKEDSEEENKIGATRYEDPVKKAEEYRTASISLLVIGIIGLVLLVLLQLGIIQIPIVNFNKNFAAIVMGALFLIFIISGITSFQSYKKVKRQGQSEEEKKEEVKEFLKTKMKKDEIDAQVYEDGMTEEVLYFRRVDYLKEKLKEYDETLTDAFIDYMIEENYTEIFEQA